MERPAHGNHFQASQVRLMAQSLLSLTGIDLRVLTGSFETEPEFAKAIFDAPFALVSHDTSPDPVFRYANQTALALFEMTWEEFTSLPSRLSAEPVHRDERESLMNEVRSKGFIANYQGVRISKSGRRFWIEKAVVWNLIDETGEICGQAAMFSEWRDV